jgi:hypothetical protein
LFHELMAANNADRGHDPRPGWFENQIRIMDSYLVPLTVQLYDVGVFGHVVGSSFGGFVEEIHGQWLYEGMDQTDGWILQG